MWYFKQKYENFMRKGHTPSPDPSPSGEEDTLSPLPFPRRLRHLDPSNSKILGTPLLLRSNVLPVGLLSDKATEVRECLRGVISKFSIVTSIQANLYAS